MFSIPVDMPTAVPILAQAARPATRLWWRRTSGRRKRAEHYAELLNVPVAIVRKTRISGTTVQAEELIGEIASRAVMVVDDMISTGATVEVVLAAHGAVPNPVVVATHGLFVAAAAQQLREAGVRCGNSPRVTSTDGSRVLMDVLHRLDAKDVHPTRLQVRRTVAG